GVRIDLRWRNVLVAGQKSLFEGLHGRMNFARLGEAFRRTAPHHYQPIGSARLAEVSDVLANLLREFHLVLALFDVRAVEQPNIILIEHGLHRLDAAEERLDLVQQVLLEYAGLTGG